MRVWREISEDEQLKSAIELTESGPGFGCISPLWMRRPISQRQMTAISKIRKRFQENLEFSLWVGYRRLNGRFIFLYVSLLR